MSDKKKSARSASARGSNLLSDEERAAMKETLKERTRALSGEADGESDVLEDRRDVGTRSRHGQAAPCRDQSQRADALAENLVRDACICQGRQGCLLLPEWAEVQIEIRDVRFPRFCQPRRR